MSARPFLADALERKGRWLSYRWLILRRLSQLLVLAGFLAGPCCGVWILEGNLASSLLLGQVPLADPFTFIQSLAAGHAPAPQAMLGAALVAGGYLLVGGRLFCAWACPINPVTDLAGWLRRRLGIKSGFMPSRTFRLALLPACLLAAWLSGSLAWEYVNPVTGLMRGLVFGLGWTGGLVAAIFLFDLFVVQRGWCGHVCPMGAFYGLLGKAALLRVSAPRRSACTDCMDCFTACPEPQVIRPALKGKGTPLILDSNCTTCGRCVDVCGEKVFRLTHRFDRKLDEAGPPAHRPS